MSHVFPNVYGSPSQSAPSRSRSASLELTPHPQQSVYSAINRMSRSMSLSLPQSSNITWSSTQRATPYPPYNPRLNFARKRTSSRPPQLARQVQPNGKRFNRSIVMVELGCEIVPRGVSRQELHQKGLVVNFVDMWTNWSEAEVYRKVEEAFGTLFDLTQPVPRLVPLPLLLSAWLFCTHNAGKRILL